MPDEVKEIEMINIYSECINIIYFFCFFFKYKYLLDI